MFQDPVDDSTESVTDTNSIRLEAFIGRRHRQNIAYGRRSIAVVPSPPASTNSP